ncbi:MAG TPA: hypothetical protein ENJ80_04300 [Gammaproteobacteria bacterium]|nr:hypothetical protein [Gammaproteobacteria bacterium]
MPTVVNLKSGLFDAELCIKPEAVLRGIEYANSAAEAEYYNKGNRKNAATLAKVPARIAKPAARTATRPVPADTALLAAAKDFRAIRAEALSFTGDTPSKSVLEGVEAFIAVTLRDRFEEILHKPIQLNDFGLAARIGTEVSPASFIHTATRCYLLTAISSRETFFIAGGAYNGIEVSADEFVLLNSEDWEGVIVE